MWPANRGDRGNAHLPFRFALGFRRREALLLAWFGCEDSLRGALVLHLNLALGTSAGRVPVCRASAYFPYRAATRMV